MLQAGHWPAERHPPLFNYPLLDPRSPLGLPPRGPSPPQNGEAPSPGGQGPVLGRRFPDQRAERARQVQRPNPRQVRVDFVPDSFSPPTTTTGGLIFGVPLARQTLLLAVVTPPSIFRSLLSENRIALRCLVESFAEVQRAKSVGSWVCSTGVQPSARPDSRLPTPVIQHSIGHLRKTRTSWPSIIAPSALRHLFLFNPRPHPPRTAPADSKTRLEPTPEPSGICITDPPGSRRLSTTLCGAGSPASPE